MDATLTGGIAGAAIGAGIGYIAPSIPSILSSIGSFFGSSFTLGSLVTASGETAISLNGAQILGIASALIESIIMFSKGSGPRLGHNQHENKMWKEAMRQLDISDKDLVRRLHRANEKYPYATTLKELLKNLMDILSKFNGG